MNISKRVNVVAAVRILRSAFQQKKTQQAVIESHGRAIVKALEVAQKIQKELKDSVTYTVRIQLHETEIKQGSQSDKENRQISEDAKTPYVFNQIKTFEELQHLRTTMHQTRRVTPCLQIEFKDRELQLNNQIPIVTQRNSLQEISPLLKTQNGQSNPGCSRYETSHEKLNQLIHQPYSINSQKFTLVGEANSNLQKNNQVSEDNENIDPNFGKNVCNHNSRPPTQPVQMHYVDPYQVQARPYTPQSQQVVNERKPNSKMVKNRYGLEEQFGLDIAQLIADQEASYKDCKYSKDEVAQNQNNQWHSSLVIKPINSLQDISNFEQDEESIIVPSKRKQRQMAQKKQMAAAQSFYH